MKAKLSKKQRNYLQNSDHSFNIQSGAVSSGKTHTQILRWYKHIYDSPDGCLLLMSGKTSESLHDNVIRDLVKMNPTDIVMSGSPLRLKVRSKNIEIACADTHNEASWGRVQGKTVCGWLADEVTQAPENFVKMAQSRCRGEGKVWQKFWTCNPDMPEHYIMQDYILNDGLDCKVWDFTMDDNPILSKEYVDELKASYSGVFYDRYILGKWVHAEGMVFDEYSRAEHIIKNREFPEHWRRVRGIDFGYTNPFVCLWGVIDEDDRLIIYDEHYKSKALMEYHANAIKNRDEGHNYNYDFTVADHDAQDNAELQALEVYTKNAKKEVIAGISAVKSRLKLAGDKKPRLQITDNCVNVIREMGLYRWQNIRKGNEKEEPLKENDHTMDALRYIIMELDRGGQPRARRV